MFSYQTVIQMHDTDAAGLLFYANQFKLMHDSYQALLDSLGLNLGRFLKEKQYFMPIVHAEADFKAPLFVGDKIAVEVGVADIGTTSFSLAYQLTKDDGTQVGSGRTVHVCVDKTTGEKKALSNDMRTLLDKNRIS